MIGGTVAILAQVLLIQTLLSVVKMKITIVTIDGTKVCETEIPDLNVPVYEFYNGAKLGHQKILRKHWNPDCEHNKWWKPWYNYEYLLTHRTKILSEKKQLLKDYIEPEDEITLTLIVLPLCDF